MTLLIQNHDYQFGLFCIIIQQNVSDACLNSTISNQLRNLQINEPLQTSRVSKCSYLQEHSPNTKILATLYKPTKFITKNKQIIKYQFSHNCYNTSTHLDHVTKFLPSVLFKWERLKAEHKMIYCSAQVENPNNRYS